MSENDRVRYYIGKKWDRTLKYEICGSHSDVAESSGF
jgi:hypothetical protein